MPTATLRLRIISRWSGDDDRAGLRLREGLSEARQGAARVGRAALTGIRGMVTMRNMAILFAPAAFTLAKAAVYVAAGLATLGVAAGAAAAPWVGLAVTAARNADKMGAAGARFQKGTDGVTKAWMNLARETASLTLGPLTDVLDGIAAAIPKLEPLVRDVAPEFARIGRDLKGWLSGSGFERFINNLRIAGVPAFRSLAAATRDTVTTLGIGFRAFLPMGQQMAEDIEGSIALMKRRAGGGGMDRLLRNFQRDMPEVARFLREADKSLGIIAGVLDDMGPGQLSILSTGLDLLNRIDPHTLIDIVLGYATGRLITGLVPLLGALTMLRSMKIAIEAAFALGGAGGALIGACAALFGMAAAFLAMARQVARMGTVDTGPLDRIRDIWNSIPKNTRATVTISGADLASVALMGIGSTWATVRALPAAVFAPRADVSVFRIVVATLVVMWTAVRIVGMVPPIFTATANAGNALTGMAQIILAWARVRTAAAAPVIFRPMAIPGSVPAVAGVIIATWGVVRALALGIVIFRATSTGMSAIGPMNQARSAWNRVKALPRSVTFTARVNGGPAVSGSNAVINAWRRLYFMPRSWMAVATVSVSGGFGGLGGGGSYTVQVNKPFVTFQPALIGPGRNPNIPDFPMDDNWSPTGNGSNVGGSVSGGNFDPGDFAGGFAKGGPVGESMGTVRTLDGDPDEKHIHIWDDIWINSKEDLVSLLTEAVRGAR